ncbi:hypothetical protein GCM10017566_31410 [Amycolatopsis bartoniae]|uniref:Chitin-binding type-2 domain-containing protein n=1 Tax=Amycolatopsis bartoniae TaxID=941986 RepID=A0A8H9MCM5_9PSEU|nr:hypothetical protein GCM10017566_31410 [Amycolatopsis bartoniae]
MWIRVFATTAVLLGTVTACSSSLPGIPAAPPQAPATTATTAPVTTAVAPQATTSRPKPTSTGMPSSKQKASAPRTTTRAAPRYGYQCRDGDEKLYSVCAGHKEWVDGQLEYTNCLSGGGTWDVKTQRCVHPSRTTTPTPSVRN